MLEYGKEQDSLLQGGRGIDHLVVAVRNLESATDDYARRLGFSMTTGGRHSTGTDNTIGRFQDETYLELLGQYDPSRDDYLSAFLEKHEAQCRSGSTLAQQRKQLHS